MKKLYNILLVVVLLFTFASCTTLEELSDENCVHEHEANFNSTSHWLECKYCGDVIQEGFHVMTSRVTKPATKTEAGVRSYSCSVCGYSYTEVIEPLGDHVHSFTTYNHDRTGHWTECICGETTTKVDHEYSETEITPATATSNGLKRFTCVCGYSYEEIIPMIGHVHSFEYSHDAEGHWTTCSCGQSTEKVAHDFSHEVTTEPTPTSKGVMTYTCECGYSYTEEIPMSEGLIALLAHDTFYVGQYLDHTEFTVQFYNVDKYEEVTDFEFNLEGMKLKATDTQVVVSYGGKSVTLPITVLPGAQYVTDMEALFQPNLVVDSRTDLGKIVLVRNVYQNGTYSEYSYVGASNVELIQNKGEIEVRATVSLNGSPKVFSKVIENKVSNVEVTFPSTVYYTLGSQFNFEGGFIEVTYLYGENHVQPLDATTVDLTPLNMNVAGLYELNVSYLGVNYPFEVRVSKEVTKIEIVKPLSTNSFVLSSTLEDVAAAFESGALKTTLTDLSTSNIDIEANMLSADWKIGTVTVTLSYLGQTTTFDITTFPNGKTVSEALTMANNTTSVFHGVVIGFNYYYSGGSGSTSSSNEVIIKDLNASKWINVSGLTGVQIGDVIEFTGKRTTDSSSSKDATRKIISYSSGLIVDYNTTDKSVIQLDLSNAVPIYTNQEWMSIFSSDNRANTHETIYKITGESYGVSYKGDTYRICLPGANSYSDQCFEGSYSGVLRTISTNANCKNIKLEELFKENVDYPGTACGYDLYVIYCGDCGNNYYANFVLLGDYCVQSSNPEAIGITPIDEIDEFYELGSDLGLVGKQFALNYVGNDDETFTVTENMISITPAFDKNVAGEYTVTVTYEGFTYSFVATYLNSTVDSFIPKEMFPQILLTGSDLGIVGKKMVVTYLGSDKVDEYTIEESMITTSPNFDKNVSGKYEVTITINGFTYQYPVAYVTDNNVTAAEAMLAGKVYSISEVSTLKNGATANFYGIFVGYNGPGNNTACLTPAEIIVKDLLNNSLMAVSGLGTSFTCGDVLVFEAKVSKVSALDKNTKDPNRVVLVGTASKTYKLASENKAEFVQLDLSKAKEYATHDDLKAVLKNTREYYSLIKLPVGTVASVYKEVLYRIALPGCTSYDDQKVVDNLSPVIKSNIFNMNTGLELSTFFGDQDGYQGKELESPMYVVILGSYGGYYLDFVVLGSYMIGE